MKRTIKATADGSKTLYIADLEENYHSGHGALQEAQHVFIENGLKVLKKNEIYILELGFGTGLNVLVTIAEFLKSSEISAVHYFTVEKYPVTHEEVAELKYEELFDNAEFKNFNQKIHESEWNKPVEILPNFFLTKFQADFFEIENLDFPQVDLVYFDCFGARVQPDLWEKPLLQQVSGKIKDGGLLTTYSSKGSVRRILQELDFKVEKRQGPPGKREMMIAWKNQDL